MGDIGVLEPKHNILEHHLMGLSAGVNFGVSKFARAGDQGVRPTLLDLASIVDRWLSGSSRELQQLLILRPGHGDLSQRKV